MCIYNNNSFLCCSVVHAFSFSSSTIFCISPSLFLCFFACRELLVFIIIAVKRTPLLHVVPSIRLHKSRRVSPLLESLFFFFLCVC